MKNYKWTFLKPDFEKFKQFREKGVSGLLAMVAVNRGLSYEDFNKIMSENFIDFCYEYCDNIVGLNSASTRIMNFLFDPNKKITIYCDYDTDGVTSASITKILWDKLQDHYFFKDISKAQRIEVKIPNRSEGYGLQMAWCENFVESIKNDDKKHLVVTFDNGITCKNQIAYLRKNGVDTVIIDHHEPEGDYPAGIVVDPKKDYDNINRNENMIYGEELCGAGLSFLLGLQIYRNYIKYLKEILEESPESINSFKQNICNELKIALAYAAIGTVGDIMPMTSFNKALVRKGLIIIENMKDDDNNPIKYLQNVLGLEEITSKDIGFSISAAINACGQMGDINTAFQLLCPQYKPSFITLEEQAKSVYKYYNESKDKTQKAKSLIKDEIECGTFDDHFFCIYETNAEDGIKGKLANHLAQETGKPSIVISKSDANGISKGSGRCPNEMLNMLGLLKDAQKEDLMFKASGHKRACGVELYYDKVEDLNDYLDKKIEKLIESNKLIMNPEEELLIDSEIYIKDIKIETLKEINKLPYANDFKAPCFRLCGDIVNAKPSKNKPWNVEYTIMDELGDVINIWAWDVKPKLYDKNKHHKIQIVGNIERNFLKPKTATLSIIDINFLE